MLKYEPLAEYLNALPASDQSVSISFARVAEIVGGLPSTAYAAGYFWANNSHAQAKAWRSAGWHVEKNSVDYGVQTVRFARGKVGGTYARRLGRE